jgi:acetyl esterase/lipase
MKSVFCSLQLTAAILLMSCTLSTNAATPSGPIELWPQIPPGDTAESMKALGEEKDISKPGEGLVAGKPLIRLGNVTHPTITISKPAPDKDTGAAVLVCPGGAYYILAMDLEGTEVVSWLNSIGVTGILLKYRVPARPNRERYDAALQDAQRAMGLIRQNAKEWGIDPHRIGVMGFSAGGHLSAALSNNYEKRSYPVVDDADQQSCKPDFTLLVYPAYLTVEKEGDRVASELKITTQTPPALLIQAEDDPVRVETSLHYYIALKNAKVAAEMDLYATGGHGYGLRHTKDAVTDWPQRATRWMDGLGVLKKSAETK